MIKVNVEVDYKFWLKKIKNPQRYCNKKLKKIIKIFSLPTKKNIVFTILLTNSLKMKKLNKKFRNKNRSTDVLSFPSFSQNNLKQIKQKNIHPQKRNIIGRRGGEGDFDFHLFDSDRVF